MSALLPAGGALVALLALAATAHAGTRLSNLASASVGRPVTAHCVAEATGPYEAWTTLVPDPAGTVTIDDTGAPYSVSPQVWLKQRLCNALVPLLYWRAHRRYINDANAVHEAAYALEMLTHEAMHVRLQSKDEGLVECTALRNLWPIVAALKLPQRIAGRVLAEARWVHAWVIPARLADGSPNPYRSVC